MTYSIFITVDDYNKLQSFIDWDMIPYTSSKPSTTNYGLYLSERYQDLIVDVSDITRNDEVSGRTFIFTSEQHYHWFLLHQ